MFCVQVHSRLSLWAYISIFVCRCVRDCIHERVCWGWAGAGQRTHLQEGAVGRTHRRTQRRTHRPKQGNSARMASKTCSQNSIARLLMSIRKPLQMSILYANLTRNSDHIFQILNHGSRYERVHRVHAHVHRAHEHFHRVYAYVMGSCTIIDNETCN